MKFSCHHAGCILTIASLCFIPVVAFVSTPTSSCASAHRPNRGRPSFVSPTDLPVESLSSLPTEVLIGGASAVSAIAAVVVTISTLPPAKLLDAAAIQQIVAGTFLQNSVDSVECVYKASRDGWSALDFHDAVDGRGSGIVVARSISGKVFGGYNPTGWRSSDDYYSSTAAFLWAQQSGKKIVKFPVLAGGNAAIFDYATGGPCFGSSDMLIGPPQAAILGGFAGPDMENSALTAGNLRRVKVSPGITYETTRDWPIRGDVQVTEVEVYCNTKAGRIRY